MKALILDGSRKDDATLVLAHRELEYRLKNDNWDVKSYTLRDMEIAPCLGCFGCWIKTPGICVINDKGRDIARDAAQSDLWVFITEITFGGYSPELKKAIDRMICLGLPFFNRVKNEVHHTPRYPKRSVMIGCGLNIYGGEEYANLFERLITRNAVNFQSSLEKIIILNINDSMHHITNTVEAALSSIN